MDHPGQTLIARMVTKSLQFTAQLSQRNIERIRACALGDKHDAVNHELTKGRFFTPDQADHLFGGKVSTASRGIFLASYLLTVPYVSMSSKICGQKSLLISSGAATLALKKCLRRQHDVDGFALSQRHPGVFWLCSLLQNTNHFRYTK